MKPETKENIVGVIVISVLILLAFNWPTLIGGW